tara:strand:+ start:1336 stop:1866 length:531 start_codon:yes stop_codon:yes gene_type:complete
MPPRKNVNPDGKSQLDFRKARPAIPSRSSLNRRPDLSNLRNDPSMLEGGVASPWKAMAMMTARIIRSGEADPALESLNAMLNVAKRMPRSNVAARATRAVAKSGLNEAESILNGGPSGISYPGIRYGEASEYYRGMAKLLGRYAGRALRNQSIDSVYARVAGGVLKKQARLWRNMK